MNSADPSVERTVEAAAMFRLLGDDARVRILLLLVRGERTVSDLTTALRLRQPNVSQHLAALRHAGVVQSRRRGKNIFYGLTDVVSAPGGSGILSVSACGITVVVTGPTSSPQRPRRNRR